MEVTNARKENSKKALDGAVAKTNNPAHARKSRQRTENF
jgi:hypothetical protein